MIWIDAHLSPAISSWITVTFEIPALALRDVGLRDAEDAEIFEAAKAQNIIFITKDSDFVDLVNRFGQPPKIILLTCGNTSNDRLKEILSSKLLEALNLLNSGEPLVEISGNQSIHWSNMDSLSVKLFSLFQNVNDWLKFAEAKNAVLLAFAGAGMTATLTVLVSAQNLFNSLRWGLISATILLCVCAFLCILSFLPKTDLEKILRVRSSQSEQPKPEDNLYFYGHLKKYQAEELLDRLNQTYLSNSPVSQPYSKEAKDLAVQVTINSGIAFIKFEIFRYAVYTLAAAIISVPVFILITFFTCGTL